MKRIICLFCLFVSTYVNAQYNPTNFTVSNKSYGLAQAATTDARSWYYDGANFVMRDYNGTSEVLSYLNLSKYRSGHFPIYVHSGGTLNSGVWTGGITLVYFFKDGTADGNLVRWYTDSTIVTPKVDTMYRKNDSIIGFTINNGSEQTILIRGTAAGGINALTLTAPSILFGTPITFTNTGGSWAGSLILTNQNANSVFAGPSTGGPGLPSWRQIVLADLPSGIPNANLQNSSINLGFGTSGTDINWGASPISLGGTATLNIPSSSAVARGLLTAGSFTQFTNKVDSTSQSNDSVYDWHNGTKIFRYMRTGGGGGGVSTVGFTAANGFTGAFANPTTTPNLTIGTSITGLLFGNGTAIAAATVSSPLTYATGTLGIQTASASQAGALSASDFISFAAKQTALSGTGYLNFTGTTPSYLTPTQVTANLNLFTSSLQGLAPLSGGGTTNFLRADGTWAAPPGGAGNTNSNIGSGYRFAVPNTNNIKTLFCAGCTLDSTTNANALTLTVTAGGSGTVTSVAASVPSTLLTIAGSPITTSGTLAIGLATASANLSFGNFTGSTATPTFGKLPLAAMATGTANSLIGYDGSGNPSGITVSTGLNLSAGVLTAIATGHDSTKVDTVGQVGTILLRANNFTTGDIGTVFTDNTGAGHLTVSGGKLHLSGGTTLFNSTLDIAGPWPIWHWRMEVHAQMTTAGSVVGIGTSSINFASAKHNAIGSAFVGGGNNGLVALTQVDNGSTITNLDTRPGAFNGVNNGTIILIVERNMYTYTVNLIDSARNVPIASPITYNYLDANGAFIMPNIGVFSLYNLGGSFDVSYLSVTSTEPTGGTFVFGDSKIAGYYSTDFKVSFAYIMAKYFHSYSAFGGGSDGSPDFIACLPQVLHVLRPKVIIMPPWSNDTRNGILTNAQSDSNYAKIYDSCVSNGIRFIPTNGFAEGTGTGTINTLFQKTFAESGRVGANVVHTYEQMLIANSKFADSIHLTDAGAQRCLSAVKQVNFIPGYSNRSESLLYGTAGQLALFGTSGSVIASPAYKDSALSTSLRAAIVDGQFWVRGPSSTIIWYDRVTAAQTYAMSSSNGAFTIQNISRGNPLQFPDPVGSKATSVFRSLATGSYTAMFTADTAGRGLYVGNYQNTTTDLAHPGATINFGNTFAYMNSYSNTSTSTSRPLVLQSLKGRTSIGDSLDNALDIAQIYGSLWVRDTLKTPNILRKLLDTTNLKPLVVDASGNHFKTDWATFGGGGGVTTVGAFSSSSIANGASISTSTITFGPADATNPGMIKNTGSQTLGATLTMPAPLFTGLASAGANDSVLTVDPTTGQVKKRYGLFNLNVANGLTAPTTDSVKLGGTLNQNTTINTSTFDFLIQGGDGQHAKLGLPGNVTGNPSASIGIMFNESGSFTDNTNSGSVNIGVLGLNKFSTGTWNASNTVSYVQPVANVIILGAPTAGSGVTFAGGSYALYVTGQSYFNSTVTTGHLIGYINPTIAAGSGAGTSPTVSIVGTDQEGAITVTTGTTPSSGATVVTVTYGGGAFPNNTFPVLTPANAITAALNGIGMVFTTGSTTNFTITSGTTALTAVTQYKWYYHVGGN